jgi:hypothetical protein
VPDAQALFLSNWVILRRQIGDHKVFPRVKKRVWTLHGKKDNKTKDNLRGEMSESVQFQDLFRRETFSERMTFSLKGCVKQRQNSFRSSALITEARNPNK